MSKTALITGITGQDGSYLAELLLKKGYEVHGIVRRVALEDEVHRLWRIRNILKDVSLHAASLESYPSLFNILQKIKPDEVYHLAAQSYVAYSFEDEFSTFNSNINGTHHMLSAVKEFSNKTKFYFAGSSEMFGKVKNSPQDENTSFYPRSSYGISKVTGYYLTKNYVYVIELLLNKDLNILPEQHRRDLQYLLSDAFYRIGKYKKAKEQVLSLLKQYESDRLYLLLAMIYESLDKNNIANQHYLKLIAQFPNSDYIISAKIKSRILGQH